MLKSLESKLTNWSSLSLIALVVANMIPILGVLFLGWDVLVIVGLFWGESVIIGLLTILRIIFASPRRVKTKHKLIGIPIFSWFFGWFISGIGVAIIFFLVVFPNEFLKDESLTQPMPEEDFFKVHWPGPLLLFQLGIESGRIMYYAMPQTAILAFFILTIRHGLSFITDYFLKGGRNNTDLNALTKEPIARIITLHFSMMIAGFLIIIFKPHMVILACLVTLKCLIEANLYFRKQFGRKD